MRARDLDSEEGAQAWDRAAGSALFLPPDTGKVSSWLRLAVSSQDSGEWTPSIVDVLNANPVTQTDTDRRAAVGASANGFPTAVFDGSDVHVWPLSATIQNQTTKTGFFIWFKPASAASVQHLVAIGSGSGGASALKLVIYANNAQVFAEAYISGGNGRFGRTGNVLSAGAWTAIYVGYDSLLGGDPNLFMRINGTLQSLTYGNLGAGGTLTTLPSVTGNALIGGSTNDDDTPTQPIAVDGEVGPNLLAFNDTLTAAEELAIRSFEAPT